METKMQNPFSLTFGKEPASMISRDTQTEEIVEGFSGENPEFHACMITGIRGSGKTVLLTSAANRIREDPSWIVIDLSPERDLLHSLAAELSNRKELLQIFRDARINLSFLGFGLEIDGVPPITDIVVALDRMLDRLTRRGKHVLVTIDEVISNRYVREFTSQFQIFLRKEYAFFLLMTGLYENVQDLQNEKSLTFLYRAPKIALQPLSLPLIASKYKDIFHLTDENALAMANITKGYSFAYQALGYLCYKRQTSFEQVLPEYDALLESNVYEKLWYELSQGDKTAVRAISTAVSSRIEDIRRCAEISSNVFSVYRDRLIKKGIVYSPQYGHLNFTLPRFREFVLRISAIESL